MKKKTAGIETDCIYVETLSTMTIKDTGKFRNSGGIGIALMRTSEKIAQLLGYDVLLVKDSVADSFYEKLGYTLYKGGLYNDFGDSGWDEDEPHDFMIPVQDVVKINKSTKEEVERISPEKWLSRSKNGVLKRQLEESESSENKKMVKPNGYLEHIFSTMSVRSSPKAHSYFK